MFKFPKDLEGHYCTILVAGIASFEVKIASVTDDEVVGRYADGEEVHVRQEAVLVYWPNKARTMQAKVRSERMKEVQARKKRAD